MADIMNDIYTSAGTFVFALGLGYLAHRKGGMLAHIIGAGVIAGSEALGKYLIDYSTTFKDGALYNFHGISNNGVYVFCGVTYATLGKLVSFVGLKAAGGLTGFIIDALFGAGCALVGDWLYGYIQPMTNGFLPPMVMAGQGSAAPAATKPAGTTQ